MMNNEGNHFEPKEEEKLSAVAKEQGYKKLSCIMPFTVAPPFSLLQL